jgi:GT2 family glycosyltransferase
VVVPRERFSITRASLESVYEHTDISFRLVYVDGGSPPGIRAYLRAAAASRGFELVRTDYYLSPNRARNLGLTRVRTRYAVFMDNDVVVAPGWLGALVRCAEETGAAIVGPLNCEGGPVHEVIHFAGGVCGIREDRMGDRIERHLIDKIDRQGQRLVDVRAQLRREPTSVAEFHCLMVRSDVFEKVGPFDEGLLSVRENLDFCMAVAQAGGAIYFEPASVITYAGYEPLALTDMPYYILRWNDAWTLSSLHHLRDKWSLTEDEYFFRQYKNLSWRRQVYLIGPLFRWIPSCRIRLALERLAAPLARMVERRIVTRYTRRQAELRRIQA